MMYRFCNSLFVLFLLLSFASCSGVKHLQEGQLLYTGTTIELIDSSASIPHKRTKNELLALTRPIPNSGFFNWYLGVYYMMGTPKKEKGIRSWIKRKIGEPPALYDERAIVRSEAMMQRYLKDRGMIHADISRDTIQKGKKVSLTYTVQTGDRYRIRSVNWPEDSSAFATFLLEGAAESFLKADDYYNRAAIDLERARLAARATDKGFADFNATYIYCIVDTSVGQQQADLHMRIRPKEGGEIHEPYVIGKTYIYPQYDANRADTMRFQDTVQLAGGVSIYQQRQLLYPSLLSRLLLQREGDQFSLSNQQLSNNHFLELGVFKFSNLKYETVQKGNQQVLNRYFYLTPSPLQEVTAEFELNNRTGNFLGTSATVTYSHKNIAGAAERLDLSLSGGLETQFGSGLQLINSADINFEANISAPRFISPFKLNRPNVKFIPRTEANFSFSFQQRVQFYTINALSLKMGYNWRENSRKRHQLYPIQLNRVSLGKRTAAFEDLLDEDPRLRQSFEDVFIAGLSYTYQYTEGNSNTKKQYSYFKTEVETAGNLLNLVTQLGSGQIDPPYEFFGLPYAQFVKLNVDYRYYYPYRQALTAARFYFGVGVPFGNADVLPYTKQFFIGGSNSIRAFRLQGLGPGSYVADVADDDAIRNQFIDQTGDIKLEMNLEYRFPLFSYLKGAVFMDAGNVWLLESDTRPEGVFAFKQFLNEIAIGTGLGFRLDFQYFVIRLDGAFALRRPLLNEGFQWTVDKIAPLSSSWRQDNLIWNLGIGYPF